MTCNRDCPNCGDRLWATAFGMVHRDGHTECFVSEAPANDEVDR